MNAAGKTSPDVPGQSSPSNPPTQTTTNVRTDSASNKEDGEAGGSLQKTVPKPRPVVKLVAAAGPALVMRIQRLEGTARERRIKEVNAMNKFELDRENNIAVTKELALRLTQGASLADLGIAAISLTGDPEPNQEMNTTSPNRLSPAPTSPANPAGNEADTNTPNDVSRASTPPGSEHSDHEITPVTIDLNRDGWPAWLEDHHKRFSAVSVSPPVEAVWQELLGFWPMLEREMGFASPVRGVWSIEVYKSDPTLAVVWVLYA